MVFELRPQSRSDWTTCLTALVQVFPNPRHLWNSQARFLRYALPAARMRNLPSSFHLRALWTAVAALSITVTAAIVVGLIYLATQLISFLQPILIPFAVAGVMAYLLDPVVTRLMRWGFKRRRAVMLVFIVVSLVLGGVAVLIVPTMVRQGYEFAREVPGYADKTQAQVLDWADKWHDRIKDNYHVELLDFLGATPKKDDAATGAQETPTQATSEWIKENLTELAPTTWNVIRRSLGGFLGVFGFLLSLIIVPLYLYYFLTESAQIASRWSDFVPLRASDFKDEVVGTITEINGYLIAFFRGQLVVSMINGMATACGLVIVGLKFGWLIGLSLCVLGMIPYLGIILCMIPAVLIASVQGGSWLIPAAWPGWAFPLIVLAIFAMVQQIDGLFVTPKIVGESVGLHPMTVILSVFLWSLVMGGLLGAILAVPMTASIKVLFQRYVWHARFSREAPVPR